MMDVNRIDWSAIWREGLIFFAGNADKAASWDAVAARWNQSQNIDEYGKKACSRIKVRPEWTLLDVGCGAGLLAIPLAKKCRQVTALDVSGEMLKYLRQNSEREHVHNISCLHRAFGTVVIGKDVEMHDVVVASRSMGWEHDLESFLRNLDAAARKRAYAIWGASDRTFDIGMYRAIGRPYGETRTCMVISNLLYKMGIRANVEIFQTKATAMSYASVEEAFSELVKRFESRNTNEALNQEERNELINYLEKTLTSSKEGTFRFLDDKPARHTLIWWNKG
jgi:SAM-dependent methyltransferase